MNIVYLLNLQLEVACVKNQIKFKLVYLAVGYDWTGFCHWMRRIGG